MKNIHVDSSSDFMSMAFSLKCHYCTCGGGWEGDELQRELGMTQEGKKEKRKEERKEKRKEGKREGERETERKSWFFICTIE